MENAVNQHFLIFQQCFVPNPRALVPLNYFKNCCLQMQPQEDGVLEVGESTMVSRDYLVSCDITDQTDISNNHPFQTAADILNPLPNDKF